MELMLAEDNVISERIKASFDRIEILMCTWSFVESVRIEPVEYENRSGFIAWTNGGWDGIANLRFQDAKYEFNCLADDLAYDERESMEQFRECMTPYLKGESEDPCFELNEVDLRTYPRPVWNAFYEGITDAEFWELFEDFQADWSDGWERADDDLFFVKFRATFYNADNSRNESGEPEVYFWCAVNTDFNYGRDNIPWLAVHGKETKQNVAEYACNVKVADLTAEKMQEVEAAMIAFLRAA